MTHLLLHQTNTTNQSESSLADNLIRPDETMANSTQSEHIDEPTPATGERRAWIRATSEFSHIFVRCDDNLTVLCPVLDESVGGVGLEVDDANIFEIGQEVELVYAAIPMNAMVRSCIEWTGGKYRVGLQWRD